MPSLETLPTLTIIMGFRGRSRSRRWHVLMTPFVRRVNIEPRRHQHHRYMEEEVIKAGSIKKVPALHIRDRASHRLRSRRSSQATSTRRYDVPCVVLVRSPADKGDLNTQPPPRSAVRRRLARWQFNQTKAALLACGVPSACADVSIDSEGHCCCRSRETPIGCKVGWVRRATFCSGDLRPSVRIGCSMLRACDDLVPCPLDRNIRFEAFCTVATPIWI